MKSKSVVTKLGEFKGHKTLRIEEAKPKDTRFPKVVCFGVDKARMILEALPEIQKLAQM